ncbi:TolC family protein [Methylococcus sp. ANG]
MAVRDNPGLADMRARAEALAAVPSQEGTLPDPLLSFNALNLPTDTFRLNQEPMTQLQVGIRQAIPFPGKLALREEAAGHEAEAATDSVAETRLRLIRDVKASWWQLYYLDRALQIVRSNQDLLRQFIDIATTKYKVGQGLQQDVLLAQVELSRLLDLEVQLVGARRNEAARLNALLNRAADSDVPLPGDVDRGLPDVFPEAKLYPVAEAVRPLLAEQRSRIDAARSRVALAEKDYYPNFELGAAYGFRSGKNTDGSQRADFATFGLSLNLPVYAGTKQSKAVDQRHSELLGRTFALQDTWAQVRKEITAARADYEQTRQQAILFDTGIIPQASQTVASMLAGYQVNKVDFLNLVQAQITLYNYEIQYWKVVSAANQALARLAAAVGEEAIHE